MSILPAGMLFPSRFLPVIALLLCLVSLRGAAAASDAQQGDYVVLLHGIARSSSHMEDMEAYLQKAGYDVVNLDYPSTAHNLQALVDIIQKKLAARLTQDKPVHFVGYSMGALLVRAVIHKYRPLRLGRVVQLAPPNQGSEVADMLEENWLYEQVYGPAGRQLTTDRTAVSDILGTVDYELGVIAGNRTIDPVSSMIIPGDDDGKVSIASTRVEGMKAHIVVAATHTFFPGNKTVQRQTLHFLKHGVFAKQQRE